MLLANASPSAAQTVAQPCDGRVVQVPDSAFTYLRAGAFLDEASSALLDDTAHLQRQCRGYSHILLKAYQRPNEAPSLATERLRRAHHHLVAEAGVSPGVILMQVHSASAGGEGLRSDRIEVFLVAPAIPLRAIKRLQAGPLHSGAVVEE